MDDGYRRGTKGVGQKGVRHRFLLASEGIVALVIMQLVEARQNEQINDTDLQTARTSAAASKPSRSGACLISPCKCQTPRLLRLSSMSRNPSEQRLCRQHLCDQKFSGPLCPGRWPLHECRCTLSKQTVSERSVCQRLLPRNGRRYSTAQEGHGRKCTEGPVLHEMENLTHNREAAQRSLP